MTSSKNVLPKVVSPEKWQEAYEQLLIKEKNLTKARDALNAERRKMPMVKLDKQYTLLSNKGPVSLLEIFEERRQLIVYHFMFGPEWQSGCEGCSWVRDAMTHPAHLQARDTNLVMISRAPLDKLEAYQTRMDWHFPIPWLSSHESDFNYDLGATDEDGEQHGVSVFIRDGSDIYRCYYVGARGVEYLGTQWSYLDLTPFGRQEDWENSPVGWPQTEPYAWCRRHDEYDE